MQAAGDVALESNRAVVAAKNAEIRRAKNVLLTEAVASLEKKVKKGKGLNKQIIDDRQERVREREWRMLACANMHGYCPEHAQACLPNPSNQNVGMQAECGHDTSRLDARHFLTCGHVGLRHLKGPRL